MRITWRIHVAHQLSGHSHFATSISNGIGAGIISYVVIKLAVGKAKDVHPILYGVAVLFALYFLRGPLESVIL